MRFVGYMVYISYLGGLFHTSMHAVQPQDLTIIINIHALTPIRVATLIGMTTGIAMEAYDQHRINKESTRPKSTLRSLIKLGFLITTGIAGGLYAKNWPVRTLEDAGKLATSLVGAIWLIDRLNNYSKIYSALLISIPMYALGKSFAAQRRE